MIVVGFAGCVIAIMVHRGKKEICEILPLEGLAGATGLSVGLSGGVPMVEQMQTSN
jgi:hypothetical protein